MDSLSPANTATIKELFVFSNSKFKPFEPNKMYLSFETEISAPSEFIIFLLSKADCSNSRTVSVIFSLIYFFYLLI